MPISAKELTQTIAAAFPLEPVPNTVVKYQDEIIAIKDNDMEAYMTVNAFLGKNWREVTYAWLDKVFTSGAGYESFFFLNDPAFAYYLPAWMTMALGQAKDGPVDLGAVAFSLCNNVGTWSVDTKGRKFPFSLDTLLTYQQKEVVAEFIKFCIICYASSWGSSEAKAAYDFYWYQFDPERKEGASPAPNPQG